MDSQQRPGFWMTESEILSMSDDQLTAHVSKHSNFTVVNVDSDDKLTPEQKLAADTRLREVMIKLYRPAASKPVDADALMSRLSAISTDDGGIALRREVSRGNAEFRESGVDSVSTSPSYVATIAPDSDNATPTEEESMERNMNTLAVNYEHLCKLGGRAVCSLIQVQEMIADVHPNARPYIGNGNGGIEDKGDTQRVDIADIELWQMTPLSSVSEDGPPPDVYLLDPFSLQLDRWWTFLHWQAIHRGIIYSAAIDGGKGNISSASGTGANNSGFDPFNDFLAFQEASDNIWGGYSSHQKHFKAQVLARWNHNHNPLKVQYDPVFSSRDDAERMVMFSVGTGSISTGRHSSSNKTPIQKDDPFDIYRREISVRIQPYLTSVPFLDLHKNDPRKQSPFMTYLEYLAFEVVHFEPYHRAYTKRLAQREPTLRKRRRDSDNDSWEVLNFYGLSNESNVAGNYFGTYYTETCDTEAYHVKRVNKRIHWIVRQAAQMSMESGITWNLVAASVQNANTGAINKTRPEPVQPESDENSVSIPQQSSVGGPTHRGSMTGGVLTFIKSLLSALFGKNERR